MKNLLLVTLVSLASGCATTSTNASSQKEPSYPVKDLQALEAQESWNELLASLRNVAPSERDDTWQGFAERGALGYLSRVKQGEGYAAESAIAEADAVLEAFPTLKKSKPFMEKRLELAITAFRRSGSNYRHSGYPNEWVNKIVEFAKSDTQSARVPQRLATEVVMNRLVPEMAFPLFQLAVEPDGSTACAASDLQPIVTAAVEDALWTEEVQALVTKKCKAELVPALRAEIAKADASADLKKNGCALLATAGEKGATGCP